MTPTALLIPHWIVASFFRSGGLSGVSTTNFAKDQEFVNNSDLKSTPLLEKPGNFGGVFHSDLTTDGANTTSTATNAMKMVPEVRRSPSDKRHISDRRDRER